MVSAVSEACSHVAPPIRVPVLNERDARTAQDTARQVGADMGFSAVECEEVALAVAELASNLIRHAGGGTLSLEPARSAERSGIQIESADSGPGFEDFEQALTDGFSTGRGLGCGLGAVNRLMDELECCSSGSAGTHIVCRRWLREGGGAHPSLPLELGAATRPHRRLRENGDAFLIRRWGNQALLGVIDGLGHGPFAQRAAQAARQYLEQHYDQPLESLFRGAGRACQATRGVVMALLRFDGTRGTFTAASIGNVEIRAQGEPRHLGLIATRGVVGLNAPPPALVEHPFTPETLLVIHSDGVPTGWTWEDVPWLRLDNPAAAAHRLLSVLASEDDDATVLVIRHSGA